MVVTRDGVLLLQVYSVPLGRVPSEKISPTRKGDPGMGKLAKSLNTMQAASLSSRKDGVFPCVGVNVAMKTPHVAQMPHFTRFFKSSHRIRSQSDLTEPESYTPP